MDNHKLIERLYKEEGLALRRKRKGRRVTVARTSLPPAFGSGQVWGIDFIHDRHSGGMFRCLTVLDLYSRFCLWLEPRTRYGAESVVYCLERLTQFFDCPVEIRLDNGPEFRSDAMRSWAEFRGIRLAFSEPGKPQQNGFVESFHSPDVCAASWHRAVSPYRRKSGWERLL